MKENNKNISYGAFIIVIAISIIALSGWFTKEFSLAGLGINSIPMAPSTILCFLLTSFAAIKLLKKQRHTLIFRAILFFVFVLCLILLIDLSFGYPINLESIAGNSPSLYNNLPTGRMSPVTSILFLMGAISLLVVTTENSKNKWAVLLATFALFVSFTFCLGYLYGTPLLYGKNIIPPAWNTSMAFSFLFTGILAGFGLSEKPLSLFVGQSVRARLMRGFLPVTVFIILVSGWINTIFLQHFNDHVLTASLVTIFSLLSLSLIILKLSKSIGNEIDHYLSFREEAEQKLKESELHFRTLANSGQALIWTAGLDKKCNYFNQPWLDFTGRELDQELGDGWAEGVHPDDLPHCFETYVSAFDRREHFSMDYRLRNRDGTYHWIQDNGMPRYNSQGGFIGYIGHCLDITDRKLATEALAKSEERYRLISSVATDYTFWTRVRADGSLKAEWIAGAFEPISGYSLEEYLERGGWRSTIHPEDLFIDDNDLDRLKNNQDIESQLRTINKSGDIVWVQIFAHPVWDYENNCLSGIYGAVKNITDRKNAEEKLINSERRFRELLEKVNLIAIILDTVGTVTFCNEHLLKLTGYSQNEIIGKNWFDLMIPSENPEVRKELLNGLKGESIVPRYENQILTRSGNKLDIVWSNAIQRNHKGEIIGVASIGEDVTERKSAENNLQETNKRLKVILENTPIAIWDWNIKNDKWYATSKYYTLLGYKPETGYADSNVWIDRIHPDDRESVVQKIDQVLKFETQQYSYTARILHANGTYRWQKVIGQAIEHDRDGKAVRMLGVRMDVDEAQKAEEEIHQLNQELEQKVKERTLELEQKNTDLERMNKLFVGRELRMVELKNQIKELNSKFQ